MTSLVITNDFLQGFTSRRGERLQRQSSFFSDIQTPRCHPRAKSYVDLDISIRKVFSGLFPPSQKSRLFKMSLAQLEAEKQQYQEQVRRRVWLSPKPSITTY